VQLGRYELLEKLASGGMGEVFLGRSAGAEGFEKLVAIKRIYPDLAGEQRHR
jgi:serine/threonine protein kinase